MWSGGKTKTNINCAEKVKCKSVGIVSNSTLATNRFDFRCTLIKCKIQKQENLGMKLAVVPNNVQRHAWKCYSIMDASYTLNITVHLKILVYSTH